MKLIQLLRFFLIGSFATFMVWSCANRGAGPQGGPKDTTPPVVLKSTPVNGSLNYSKSQIDIYFDEIVLLEKSFEKVVVSPPQVKPPVVKALGKRVMVQFEDSMQSQTTYTVDFADAIVDNNEKNPLLDYSFSFSTGNAIDTMKISGILIDARTLNPVGNVLVGTHYSGNDTAFTSKPFVRISKSNIEGKFTISNLRGVSYNLFALGDLSNDYLFDQPGEAIAYSDSTYTPKVEMTYKMDTIWADSLSIDTIYQVRAYNYSPQGIVLKYFNEDFVRQYLIKSERKQRNRFQLYFNAPVSQLPHIEAINCNLDGKILLQSNLSRDTLTYWLKDSTLINLDTLVLRANYLKTDSLNQLVFQTDTLNLAVRRKAKDGKDVNNAASSSEIVMIKPIVSVAGQLDLNKPIDIKFDTPTDLVSPKGVRLEQKVDSSWVSVPIGNLVRMDSVGMRYQLQYPWKSQQSYRVSIDSLAFLDIYNHHNDNMMVEFKTRSIEEYATLFLEIFPNTGKEMVELLNSKDEVVSILPISEKVKFEYLMPGDYYVRLYVDANGNKQWDTGNFRKRLQPEEVYYFPFKMTLRAFWEVEEYWEYMKESLLDQKPKELIKDNNQK